MPTTFPSAPPRQPDLPPPGSFQLFDGLYPALAAGTYQIAVKQVVTTGQNASPSYELDQGFVVEAPEFVIDQGIVRSVYPPDQSSDDYGQSLPFVVLADPSLPWERSLVPGDGQPNPASPAAWMALLVFAEGEILLQPGTDDPVAVMTVQELVASDPNVLKPQFPDNWLSVDTLASSCQTITVSGDAFPAVAPQTGDLPYLAHCRAQRPGREGDPLLAVVLSNRLAVADTRQELAAPLRYYAHLVSLEGYAAYLGPNAAAIPQKADGSGPQDVMLVSLTGWTFVSQPQGGAGFTQLMKGLIQSQEATAALRLPAPPDESLPDALTTFLADGYAPLTFVAGTGETSFAWYRGPCTPVVPVALPRVGDPPVEPRHATSADALMIYLSEQGLFDLSYAAAWNVGRALALADSRFPQLINRCRRAARTTLARMTQRMTLGHFAGCTDLARLAAPQASRTQFLSLVADGLGRRWTDSVRASHPTAAADRRHRPITAARRAVLRPGDVLALPGAAEVVAGTVQEELDAIAVWLADLSLLRPVPFSYLVPDPRMLPPESIRFFYVDQGWIDAAVAGALSLALRGALDIALLSACRPYLETAVTANLARRTGGAVDGRASATGMLIRSQLVSDWPNLVVAPSQGGGPLPFLRDDCVSPTVRLSLFQGVPDTVTLSEPGHSPRLGFEDGNVYPRCVTLPAATGAQITNTAAVPVAPVLRTPAAGAIGGVIQVGALAGQLATAAGVLAPDASATVQWNGTPLTTTLVNGNQLTANVPASLVAAAGTATVTVVSAGATSAPAIFTIEPVLAIDALVPDSCPTTNAEITVTVLGRGFPADAVVQTNAQSLSTQFLSAGELKAVVPAGQCASAATLDLNVFSSMGVTGTLPFVVEPPLAVDALEPDVVALGSQNATLTIRGRGFGAAALVLLNGLDLDGAVVSPTEMTVSIEASVFNEVGSYSLTVAPGDGSTVQCPAFNIVPADPAISSLDPPYNPSGGPDFVLNVQGVGFTPDSVVQWNTRSLATRVAAPGVTLAATVPASLITTLGLASITVIAHGQTSSAFDFTVSAPVPLLASLTPTFAQAGGSAVTITVDGTNFAPDAKVFWNGDALSTVVVDVGQVTASVPTSLLTSAAGPQAITVESDGATSNALTFTVVAAQPVIGLLEPSSAVAGAEAFTLTVTCGFGAADYALHIVRPPVSQPFTAIN